MSQASRGLIRWIAVVGITLLPACGGDESRPTDSRIDEGRDPFEPQTSARSVLRNLILSYQYRKIEQYSKLFDASEFAFEFSQRDHEHDPTIGESWSFDQDRQSTVHMFADDDIDKIALRFTSPAAVHATASDQLPGGPEGVWKVAVQNVHLEVHTTDGAGSPLEYLVDNDGADFFFREYPAERINGEPIWRIVRWRDKPAGGMTSATEKATWGRIKLHYF